jgi:hypothetical protein
VVLGATAVGEAGAQSVLIDEVSSSGAKLRGRNLPECGRDMLIRVGEAEVFATVAWSTDEQCGISFEPPLDQQGVLRLKHQGRFGTARLI